MDSPLLEARPCPTCPGLIAVADPHRFCFECLGADHAMEGGGNSPTCSACRALPRLRRLHRLDHFQQARYAVPDDDQDRGDVEVVEMDEEDGEVPFVFALPASRAAPLVEEGEDEEDFSLVGRFWQRGATTPICQSGFPDGDGHGSGACGPGASSSATTQTGEPTPPGVLWPGPAGPAGFCLAPAAGRMAVVGVEHLSGG
ncbi:hypothetical protein OYC64_009175 [Pagothenia borchgrevinki]|uniref:RING-type domain-containing protein n=1 Tax=Pagothenia borchgrevinki TaxID=8213 RepID=A0ABD2H376_PAGBO